MPESASDRFARAVEGGPVGADLDDELRRDLAVVAALRQAGEAARLDDVARQRMRRQLMATLAAPAEEAAEPEPVVTTSAAPITISAERRRPAGAAGVRGRLLIAVAAALCLLAALSGTSLVMARDALPGDALYGFKRSAESAQLGFTFGPESRGFKHLQFATARLDELETLKSTGATTDSGPYQTALASFDTDAAAGSRLLIEAATNGDGQLLAVLHEWAGQQSQRIDTATPGLPEETVTRSAETRDLLTGIADRATVLQGRMSCLTVTSGAVDRIGLLPADGPCEPANQVSGPNPTGQPGPSRPGGTGLREPDRQPDDQPDGPANLPATQAPAADRPINVTQPPAVTEAVSGPPLLPAPEPAEPGTTDVVIELPLLELELPPLLPGLPGLRLG